MADAVLVERHYPAGMAEEGRLRALSEEFGPVLGGKRAWVRHVHLGRSMKDLLTATPDAPPYFFPKLHPRAGQDRYAWADRGDGVLYGTLAPDEADPAEAARLDAIRAQQERANAEAFLDTPAGRKFAADRMLAARVISADEHAKLVQEVANAQ